MLRSDGRYDAVTLRRDTGVYRGRVRTRALCRGPLASDRNRHAAAAGAGVSNPEGRGGVRERFEQRFNQQFCFRPWNEHRGRDLHVEAPELAVADDIRHRFARAAAANQLVVDRSESIGRGGVDVGEIALGRPAEHVLRNQPCVEVRDLGRDARIPQVLARSHHARPNRGLVMGAARRGSRGWRLCRHEAVASFSFSDW